MVCLVLSVSRKEIVFKHYIPVILLVVIGVLNYAVYINSVELGAFYAHSPESFMPPMRDTYDVLVMDLVSGSKTLIEGHGFLYGLNYISQNCDSCVIYVVGSGLDYYVLILTIVSFIAYIYAVRRIGLNVRLLLLVLLLIGILYTSLMVYVNYNSIPYTRYRYTETDKPILVVNNTGTAILDVNLEPDTLIAIKSSKPFTVIYLRVENVGGKTVIKDYKTQAVQVTGFSDYISSNDYNAVAITTLTGGKPSFIYRKISIEHIRGDLPIVNYTPLIVLAILLVFIYTTPKITPRTEKATEGEVLEEVTPQQSSTDSSDQA